MNTPRRRKSTRRRAIVRNWQERLRSGWRRVVFREQRKSNLSLPRIPSIINMCGYKVRCQPCPSSSHDLLLVAVHPRLYYQGRSVFRESTSPSLANYSNLSLYIYRESRHVSLRRVSFEFVLTHLADERVSMVGSQGNLAGLSLIGSSQGTVPDCMPYYFTKFLERL